MPEPRETTSTTAAGAAEPGLFNIHVNNRVVRATYEQAFAYGHHLLENGHPELAEEVYESLSEACREDRRPRLMLARCKAEKEHFGACMEILEAIFEDEEEPLVQEFQTAFVFRRVGMLDEAVREVNRIVKQHKDLPTACLFLGDMLASSGKFRSAERCWRIAMQRDEPNGAVATTAEKQIQELRKRTETAQTG
jgi:hypothetical protein